jgi:hypothetical protein
MAWNALIANGNIDGGNNIGWVFAGDAIFTVTGVSATSSLGTAIATISITAPATGVSATGAVGSVAVITEANVSVAGIAAVGNVGALNIIGDALFNIAGVSSIASIGIVDVTGDANAVVSLNAATANIGIVTVTTTSFNFEAVKELYDRVRTVYVERGTTSAERTVFVSF